VRNVQVHAVYECMLKENTIQRSA